MDNDYSWTKFNPAAARKLCAYSNRREELLSWLYSALPEETNYLHGPDHKKLTDIDPFTVFGVMNRHISQEKNRRRRTSAAFLRSTTKTRCSSALKTARLQKTLITCGRSI